MKQFTTFGFGLFCVLAFNGAITLASIPDASGVFHACYNTSNGSVRVIDTATDACRSPETAISWSMVGPMGPPGIQGPQGPQGPAGFGALRVVDRNGQVLGQVLRGGDFLDDTVIGMLFNGRPYLVKVRAEGFILGGIAVFSLLEYTTPDCTGQPFGSPSGGNDLWGAHGLVDGNSFLYADIFANPPAQRQDIVVLSQKVAGGVCTPVTPFSDQRFPLVVVQLDQFVPPFRIIQ